MSSTQIAFAVAGPLLTVITLVLAMRKERVKRKVEEALAEQRIINRLDKQDEVLQEVKEDVRDLKESWHDADKRVAVLERGASNGTY